MKKMIFTLVVLGLILGAAYLYLQPRVTPSSAAAPAPMAPVKGGDRVVAQGRVVPARYAELGMSQGGLIAEVLVAPGEAVKAGQVLIRLETTRQGAAIAQVQAELKVAQAQLARAKLGPTEADLAEAQAQVATAQAEYARLSAGARQEAVSAAQAALRSAQVSYDAAVKAAGANNSELTAAQAAVDKARAALDRAQAAYDRVAGQKEIGMLPESLALQSATIDLRQAQAAYEALSKRASPEAESKIQMAAAAVAQAQANLAAINPTPEELGAALAKVDQAKAVLLRLKQGPRGEDIAVAQAEVDRASAAVLAAQAAARDLELRAPFDGTVAWMDATAGESMNPGAPVIRLAQLATWQVLTEDLTEVSVGQIRVGSPASLKFDAIPGLVLRGAVERIDLVGEKKQGDMTYAVTVRPEKGDDRLRWNMTAAVEIGADANGGF